MKLTTIIKTGDKMEKDLRMDFHIKIGYVEGLLLMEKRCKIGRVRILKEIYESKIYKQAPGYSTMDAVLRELNFHKTTGYQILKAIEFLGMVLVELLLDMEVPIKDIYLLSKSGKREFEVVNPTTGEIKYEGETFSSSKNKTQVIAVLVRSLKAIKHKSL